MERGDDREKGVKVVIQLTYGQDDGKKGVERKKEVNTHSGRWVGGFMLHARIHAVYL